MVSRLNIDLRALEAFVAVVEAGGMTAAARRLGTTQSAVSQTIAHLEETLGVQVLDRAVRPPQPTAAGDVLYDRAKALLADARELGRIVRAPAQGALPHLRIGLVDTFAATVAPHLIQALRDAAVQWSVRSGLSPEHEAALLAREVDIVVAGDVMQDTPGIERHELLREPFVLAVPQSYEGPTDTLDTLSRGLDFVRYTKRSFFGRKIEGHLRRLRLEPPHRLEFDTADAVMAMVAAGVGWAITTPLCFLQALAYAERIRCLPLPGPGFGRQLTLFSRADELGQLPARIAAEAAGVLSRDCLPAIAAHAPWMVEAMAIGQAEDGA
jgi:DNA-binding transcriptional LysR family regulator